MAFFGRADKIIMGDVQNLPEVLKPFHHLIHQLLGAYAPLLGGFFDFHAVLVRPGEEKHLPAQQALVTGHHIGGHSRVGVADMWDVIDVINGSGYVENLFRGRRAHNFNFLPVFYPLPSGGFSASAGNFHIHSPNST